MFVSPVLIHIFNQLSGRSFPSYAILACVAWRFWLGELSDKGGRGQRNREEIGAGATFSCVELALKGLTSAGKALLYAGFPWSLTNGHAVLMSPSKGEMAIHGCHCPHDMADIYMLR